MITGSSGMGVAESRALTAEAGSLIRFATADSTAPLVAMRAYVDASAVAALTYPGSASASTFTRAEETVAVDE
jgi:hypothetical protein